MSEKAFEFLPMPERSAKPRSAGLTMVIDTGLGYRYTEDLLEICADYIDLWKLGWATTQLQPLDIVRRKVELLRSHDISVCNGGTLLELSEHQNRASELFAELREMGADATEISSGSLDIAPDRVCELIAEAREAGLVPYCEVGCKLPERDLAADEYNAQLKQFLAAGAEKVIVEARESGASVGLMDAAGEVQLARMQAALDGVDPARVIFEAPRKSQQIFFLREFGPETNLGNIAPTDVISVETLRRGLRGDTVEDFYFVIGERHLAASGRGKPGK